MSVERLVDGLWGELPPRHAAQVARTYVSRLRKVVNVEGALLFSEASGYVWRPAAGSFDLPVFENALAAADAAKAGGDLGRADRVLGEALALWRGEPLAGIAAPWAEAPRTRLVEKCLTIREAHCRFGLELGRHAQEVAELMELCRTHPFREGLRELLMLALHRCGVISRAAHVLAERMGPHLVSRPRWENSCGPDGLVARSGLSARPLGWEALMEGEEQVVGGGHDRRRQRRFVLDVGEQLRRERV
ncbi:transcriptional activator [Nocardia pseudobrasiliensis]|uniref:Transcriptional activator n=1 Tax=Nocardia pseudobrasiliensis TaxID=45979 RepID=A0A370IEZ5_9NOCA|nr:BTAD domain-containing putative transcriptional regulator [Nocardia pseudobrasiliensis]RDI69287.1 transcriptional activator [Nocardia pseudobrasiliensis]